MKDYFSHDYNARNDKKLAYAFMKHGLQAIGAYWCIVEMLYEEGGYLPLSEYERITFELRTSENVVKFIIFDSGLFKNDSINFWSESAIDRLKLRSEKSEKARKSIEHRWNNKKQNTNVLRQNNECNTIKESKVKESKVNIRDAAKAATQKRISVFKESLYPFTKNKGGLYTAEMVREFFEYWSELNKSETKMLWELKPTFQISKRLATWAKNEKPNKQQVQTNIYKTTD